MNMKAFFDNTWLAVCSNILVTFGIEGATSWGRGGGGSEGWRWGGKCMKGARSELTTVIYETGLRVSKLFYQI